MEETLKIFDIVVLIEDISSKKLKKGTIGTILEIFNEDAYMVEFAYNTGVAFADPVLKRSQLLKVIHEPAMV